MLRRLAYTLLISLNSHTWITLSTHHFGYSNASTSLSTFIEKIFCRNERDTIASTIRNTALPRNKTLVVVLINSRSHHLTWNNFDKYLLNAISADLAMAVLESSRPLPNTSEIDSFRSNAKFVWEIQSPKDGDYIHYYNDISNTCYNHSFNETYARKIGSINSGPGGWLGCIKASGQSSCGALTWFFNWFAMQKLLEAKLYKLYSQVIITRSDIHWVGNHIHPV
mmetsp:Transcript_17750/g.25599  ORF Transcript_17750/g.25599 Transcript_17750/m.25599 type:complete len:224 (+) Transcript_17750:24-695(+)